MKNNLFTLSYFRKRLHDEGISSRILINDYNESDNRYWTISIHDELKILCTCIKQSSDDFHFIFDDYGQLYGVSVQLKTKSMNTIVNHITDMINKE